MNVLQITGPPMCLHNLNIERPQPGTILLQEHLGVPVDVNFTSCSEEVDRVLHADVMKSVANLLPGLLKELPILLYQGKLQGEYLLVKLPTKISG